MKNPKTALFIFVTSVLAFLVVVFFIRGKNVADELGQLQQETFKKKEAKILAQSEAEKDEVEDLKNKSFWINEIRPHRFRVADLDMPVIFVESEIDEELKQVILADLHLIYGDWCDYKKYNWDGRIDRIFNVSGDEYVCEEKINFDGAYAPSILNENFGWLGSYKDIDSIFIPGIIVDAYRVAWQQRKNNIIVYNGLEEFVAQVNSATADSPLKVLPEDIVWTPQQDIPQPLEIPNVVETFSAISLRGPSLLEIKTIQSEKDGGIPSFSAEDYILQEAGNVRLTHQVLVFHQNRWKFAYAQYGT